MPETVRVSEMIPPGHIRTPFYLRGKVGEIERKLGPFGNPEQLAYGLQAEKLPLLRVRFTMAEVWGEDAVILHSSTLLSRYEARAMTYLECFSPGIPQRSAELRPHGIPHLDSEPETLNLELQPPNSWNLRV